MSLEDIKPCGEFEERLRFETLIADLSLKFVNLPPDAVDQEIFEAQKSICRELSIDLSGLWQWSEEDGGTYALSHFYSIDGGHVTAASAKAREVYPWCQERIRAHRTVVLSNMDDLPIEASRDRESARLLGIKSSLIIPLSVGGNKPIGALAFNTTRAERDWPSALTKRLQLVAQIFANALARKRADQVLREAAEINRATFDQAAVGIAHVGIDGRLLRVNDKFCDIVGYPRDELAHLTFQDITHPDDLEKDLEFVRRVLAGKINNYSMEKRYFRKDRSVVWANLSVSLVKDPAGEPRHFISVVQDITQNKKAGEEFRSTQDRLEAAVDLAALGCYEVDFEEPYCFVDDRFSDICGIPPGQMQNLQPLSFWMQHLHADDLQRVLDEREKLHTGLTDRITVEYRYLHPDKGHRWIQHIGRVSRRLAAGQAIRTFGVVRDITLQKQAESDARELRNDLMHLARVNTVSVLSGSLAHELNQPLGIILSNAQAAEDMLVQTPLNTAEIQAAIDSIIAADRRAGEVISQLRGLLKRGQASLKPLRLNEVIEEVLRLIKSDLIGRGVNIVRELAPDLPPVAGDRVQLQQLVLNLTLNGADAMAANEPGSRRMYFRTELHGNRVRASVRDQGCGLPKDTDRLFQPFFTTKQQGLGMGLAICRSIASAHDGRLWAEPGPGRGAVFHLELPVAQCTDSL